MSKIIGLSLFFFFAGLTVFAQSPNCSASTKCKKTTSCKSVEACAKKMGMTVEECKAICEINKSASASEAGESKTVVNWTSNGGVSDKKPACATKASCAKATGMSKKECKKKCESEGKSSAMNENLLN